MPENEQVVEDDEIEEVTDATDWEARARKLEEKAIGQRAKTKELKAQLAKFQEAVLPSLTDKNKKGFDYAEKAYLKASGIQATEYQLVQEVMQATGKSLDAVLDSKYFQADLKEQRDAQATKEAIPSGSKRSSASARTSVDYWIAKGELPPWSDRELRYKVVAEKRKIAQNNNQFAD